MKEIIWGHEMMGCMLVLCFTLEEKSKFVTTVYKFFLITSDDLQLFSH
jgi:general stress protein CsbA